MATLLIRDLDDVVMERLRASAEANHRSLAGEVRALLATALDTAGNRVRETDVLYHAGPHPMAGTATVESNPWQPVWGAVPGLRARIATTEDIAPVFPHGVPWHEADPV